MNNEKLGEVDGYECYLLKNKEDLIENEKKMLSSFHSKYWHNSWVLNNYQKIDNCRLKCPFSHFDQVIIVLKDSNNNIVTGASCNLNMKEELQLEMQGFSIDEFKENDSCLECLYFYSVLNDNPLQQTSTMLKWTRFVLNYFKEEMGKAVLFGTCSGELLKLLDPFDCDFYDSLDTGHNDKLCLFRYYL